MNGIALQLGLHPKELCIERFKVDRQKLENMIKSNVFSFIIFNLYLKYLVYIINIICVDASPTEGMNAAECFFENVSLNSSYTFLLQRELLH